MLNEMYTHNSRSLGICNYLRSLFDWTQLSTHFHIDLEMAEIVMNFNWIIIGIATEFKEKEMSSRPEPSSQYMNQFFLHSFFPLSFLFTILVLVRCIAALIPFPLTTKHVHNSTRSITFKLRVCFDRFQNCSRKTQSKTHTKMGKRTW